MLEDTISKIRARIETSSTLDAARRAELLTLVADLQSEIARLPQTHQQHAQNIAACAEISTQAATDQTGSSAALAPSLSRLEESVVELETSHPQLVAVVNRISNMLSNMGI